MVLRHDGAVHVSTFPNRVISLSSLPPHWYYSAVSAPAHSEVPIPWVYTEYFVHDYRWFTRPSSTSTTNFIASPAKSTMFCSRSPEPVSISRVYVPLGVDTASATYPLTVVSLLTPHPYRTKKGKRNEKETYGVRFLVLPPVGPAVPLSQTVYVDPNAPRT